MIEVHSCEEEVHHLLEVRRVVAETEGENIEGELALWTNECGLVFVEGA